MINILVISFPDNNLIGLIPDVNDIDIELIDKWMCKQ